MMHGVAVTKKVVNFSLKWRNQRSRPYKLVLELLELPATQKQAATASPHFSVKAFVQIENERVVQIKLCFTVNSYTGGIKTQTSQTFTYLTQPNFNLTLT